MQGHFHEAWTFNPNVFPILLWAMLTALLPERHYVNFGKLLSRYRIFEFWLLGALIFWWARGL